MRLLRFYRCPLVQYFWRSSPPVFFSQRFSKPRRHGRANSWQSLMRIARHCGTGRPCWICRARDRFCACRIYAGPRINVRIGAGSWRRRGGILSAERIRHTLYGGGRGSVDVRYLQPCNGALSPHPRLGRDRADQGTAFRLNQITRVTRYSPVRPHTDRASSFRFARLRSIRPSTDGSTFRRHSPWPSPRPAVHSPRCGTRPART